MDDQELHLSPEMITDCRDWLAEAETVIAYILKWTEKFLDAMNIREQDPEIKAYTDVLKLLSMTRKFANKAITISRESAEALQSQNAFESLVDILFDLRSQIIGVYDSILLAGKISQDIDYTDIQKKILGKLGKYAEILELLARDTEPFKRALEALGR